MSLSRTLLLAAIRGYKRYLSPRKGFGCAYRIHLGACSCSTLGLRAVSRYGAWRGLGVLRLRVEQCRLVADELRAQPFVVRPAQAGFVDCDLPCDGSCIDASSCSCGDLFSADSACEIANCVGCDIDGCEWLCAGRKPGAAPRRPRRRGDPIVWEPGPDSQKDGSSLPADRRRVHSA